MAKKVKMVLYAEPGVGKSTFASKAPSPFFITTDGNYEWLDRPEEDHIQINSWEQAKKVFSELNSEKYNKYQTIVVDLIEDTFKWCEYEYCKRNKISHMSDLGFGKAYDETRNEFYIEISKLLGLDKHVILLSHGLSKVEKDRRGVELTKYVPSSRIPDKVWDMIEGRVRYFLRAYVKAEEGSNGKLLKRRYLSIVPKENEYGISRGLDEAVTPEDISLSWDSFAMTVGVEATKTPVVEVKTTPVKPTPVVKPTPTVKPTFVVNTTPVVETKKEVKVEPVPENNDNGQISLFDETIQTVVEAEPVVEETPVVQPKIETPVVSTPTPAPVENRPLTQEEKIAAIKAKFAKLNK